ncbi:hypothetical protein ANN_24255 [Periplaneta americana]|uniref:Uncharacterized protein n=1 Tax=Periplaneta americana TaxID=6978 RepID=A0ABQ8S2S5_PERAM|nr:hypothetical protein ANN_24255 [Periplaneta americana]
MTHKISKKITDKIKEKSGNDIEEKWKNLKDSLQSVAEEILGWKQMEVKNEWFDEDCQKSILDRWVEHFKETLNKERNRNDEKSWISFEDDENDGETQPPTKEEIGVTIKCLKNNKSPGCDSSSKVEQEKLTEAGIERKIDYEAFVSVVEKEVLDTSVKTESLVNGFHVCRSKYD